METKISILKELLETSRSLQSELIRIEATSFSKERLSSAAARVIVLLHDSGALSVPYIGRATGSSRQNIQMVVNRLQRAGVVMAETNPHHKRSSRVVLTERGEKLHQFIVSKQNRLFRSMTEDVSEEDLRAANRCLQTLTRQLKPTPVLKQGQEKSAREVDSPERATESASPESREQSPPPMEEEDNPLSLL